MRGTPRVGSRFKGVYTLLATLLPWKHLNRSKIEQIFNAERYVFWCLFQALAPLIWFYPLNELDITGYEAFALVLFSPVLLTLPTVRCMLTSRPCMAVLRLTSVFCLASVQASDTLSRLMFLCAGCFCLMLILTNTLWSSSEYQRNVTYWGLMLGLFAFIGSRIWFVSFVPVWWNNQSNAVVLAIGVIASISKISQGDDHSPLICVKREEQHGCLAVSAALGSLFYLTHSLFGDVSIVSRWSVTSYPHPGPMPNPWGTCSEACWANNFTIAWGVILASFTISCWRPLVSAVLNCSPVKTILLSMFVWLCEILFSVWTVAYNFVPGGVYTRERTDALMTFVILSIGYGLYKASKMKNTMQIGGDSLPNWKIKLILFLITSVSLAGFIPRNMRQRKDPPLIAHPRAHFSCAIWTFHFGYDNQGWQSLERSAQFLKETGADVITLLESDASKPFLGNNDLAMWLSEELDMYVDFGPSTKDHSWGNLLLSKYPIVKSKHLLLPSPKGELAPAVTATINMTGHLVDFVVTHMGNHEDVLDRALQAKVLARELRRAKNPVVFMGYITSEPESRDYDHILKKGKMHDIDDLDYQRWCEYIFYRDLIRLGYARISHGGLSDTELQIGKFRIPRNHASFEDHFHVTLDVNKIPKRDRFNPIFGNFQFGHNPDDTHLFHMSTPKYFVADPNKKIRNRRISP
ncbi:hypothetical protein CAPTEDRAFT_227654 [Capitella teleta]|uniref:PGAP2-interacting protein n=1 Tax=Capitella teleta TaxID=283909 RepID=R7TPU8_CAPTE|nr:hypothetical protein CAPTEDRAFT_227654 [Capitella teleta]|eukprot:ELT95898.1 hypothetical protein CAPTEDRAFT_227654 [Capitella teleta]